MGTRHAATAERPLNYRQRPAVSFASIPRQKHTSSLAWLPYGADCLLGGLAISWHPWMAPWRSTAANRAETRKPNGTLSLSAYATGANDAEEAPSLPLHASNALPSRHLPTPLSDPCTARCPVPTDAPWLRLNYLSSLSIIHDSFSSNIGRLHRTRLRLVSGEQAEACHYALASRTGPQLRCSEATYALEGIKSPRRHKAHSTHCWQALESAGGSRRSP